MPHANPMPVSRLREILGRQAHAIVNGRRRYEREVLKGRKSDKPLPKIEVHPEHMLALLAHIEELETEREKEKVTV